jgi:hypothetical protein
MVKNYGRMFVNAYSNGNVTLVRRGRQNIDYDKVR